jgi:formylglycine-generating enzyme required for sulfatase activity
MAGNVLEWTRSLWTTDFLTIEFKYPYNPNDGRENLEAMRTTPRVMRGGSWFDSRGIARCADRSRGSQLDKYINYGFRVVVAATSSL